MRRISAVFFALSLAVFPALAPAPVLAQASSVAAAAPTSQGRAFTPEDWYRLHTVSSPAMSPDGRHVAFTVTTVEEGENDRHSEVWMVPTAGGDPVRLTSPAFSSSNPRWSQDGAYLHFSSNRPGGSGNTWTLHGPASPGEAFQWRTRLMGSMPARRAFAVSTGPARGRERPGDGTGSAPADAFSGWRPPPPPFGSRQPSPLRVDPAA